MTTHLKLNGGTLNIKEYDLFYDWYVKSIESGQRLFIVEKRDEVFKMFLDIDCQQELDFVKLCIDICKILNLGPCNLAKAEPREMENTQMKYGVHMIWDCPVTVQHANSLRLKLLDEYGEEWSKIFDKIGSGLRMLWSHKMDEGSTCYEPWGYIEGTHFVEFSNKEPSTDFLKLFSIKTENKISTLSIKYNLEHDNLEDFIKQNVKGQENIKITGMRLSKSKAYLCIFTNSTYCSNIKRRHKSNHVYFIIKPCGFLCQKCTDSECLQFCGRSFRLPKTIKELYIHYIK